MPENISPVSQAAYLVIQLGIILFAAHLGGSLASRVKIPAVIGEVSIGILIGPYLLGAFNLGVPGFEHGIFPLAGNGGLPVSMPLYGIAIIGSIILLFISGLETDLRMFLRYSLTGTVVGIGGLVLSFVCGAGLGVLGLGFSMLDPRTLFLGILCTATSVGITARILSDKRSMDSPEGTTILAAAVIDDVLGIIGLAVVMGMIGASDAGHVNWKDIEWIALKSISIWLGATAIGLYFAHRIAHMLRSRHSAGVFSMLVFAGVLIMAGFFEQVGLAMIVGAYGTGLCLSKTDISFSIERTLRGVYSFLVPVFFVVMGMMVDVRVLADWEVIRFGLLYTVLAILAKVIGCALPAWLMNFNALGALRVGLGMIPRGEVALIIAGIGATTMMQVNGHAIPVMDSKLFGVVIIMTLLTTLIAPPLLSLALASGGSGVKKEQAEHGVIELVYALPDPQLGELLLRGLIQNFDKENFLHSEITDDRLIHFRRSSQAFSLEWGPGSVCIKVDLHDAFMVKAVIRETVADLHASINALKLLNSEKSFANLLSQKDLPELKTNRRIISFFDAIVPDGCIVVDYRPESYEEAIIGLIKVLNDGKHVKEPLLCIENVLANEAISSSCFPEGIALPHARTDGVDKLVSVIGISRTGFARNRGERAGIHIVILSLCPKHASEPYLQYVSHVAAVLAEGRYSGLLATCRTPDQVRSFFKPEPTA